MYKEAPKSIKVITSLILVFFILHLFTLCTTSPTLFKIKFMNFSIYLWGFVLLLIYNKLALGWHIIFWHSILKIASNAIDQFTELSLVKIPQGLFGAVNRKAPLSFYDIDEIPSGALFWLMDYTDPQIAMYTLFFLRLFILIVLIFLLLLPAVRAYFHITKEKALPNIIATILSIAMLAGVSAYKRYDKINFAHKIAKSDREFFQRKKKQDNKPDETDSHPAGSNRSP